MSRTNDEIDKEKRLAELEVRLSQSETLKNFTKQGTGLQVKVHPSLAQFVSQNDESSSRTILPKSFVSTKSNIKAISPVNTGSMINNPYLDTTIKQDHTIKKMKFHQKGKFISEANKLRKIAQLEELCQKIDEQTRKKGIDIDIISDAIVRREPVPLIEWWDEQYFPTKDLSILRDDSMDNLLSYEAITDQIYHPKPISPPLEPLEPPPRPLILTKKERKKLRRQNRLESQKQKREMIRLGLLPPEETKLTMSNYMKVLTDEAIHDPTKMENIVQNQIQKRKELHDQTNLDRQLTKEEKREKKKKKYKEELNGKVIHIAAFKVHQSLDSQYRFKIAANARQNYLVGVAIIHSTQSLIIVEGGSKAIQRYTRLLTRRIKWGDACKLLWQGTDIKLHFHTFELLDMISELSALNYLKDHNLEHLWHCSIPDSSTEAKISLDDNIS